MSSGREGLTFATFAVGRRIVAVPDMKARSAEVLIIDIHFDELQKSKTKRIALPGGAWIEWVDW